MSFAAGQVVLLSAKGSEATTVGGEAQVSPPALGDGACVDWPAAIWRLGSGRKPASERLRCAWAAAANIATSTNDAATRSRRDMRASPSKLAGVYPLVREAQGVTLWTPILAFRRRQRSGKRKPPGRLMRGS